MVGKEPHRILPCLSLRAVISVIGLSFSATALLSQTFVRHHCLAIVLWSLLRIVRSPVCSVIQRGLTIPNGRKIQPSFTNDTYTALIQLNSLAAAFTKLCSGCMP